MNRTDEQGREIGARVFAWSNHDFDWILGEIKSAGRDEIPEHVKSGLVFEAPIFAVWRIGNILAGEHGEPRAAKLLDNANDAIVGLLSELRFEPRESSTLFAEHKDHIANNYYRCLTVSHRFYAWQGRRWRQRMATVMGSRHLTEGVMFRWVLDQWLEDVSFTLPDVLLKEFVSRTVRGSNELISFARAAARG
jgi:hypothetical protein